MFIKKKLLFLRRKKKWRKLNAHNYTFIVKNFDFSCVEVGNYTYGGLFVLTDGDNDYKLKIGSFCSIAPQVAFILSSDHPLHNISTYPFKVKFTGQKKEAISKGDILIEDDVWIAFRATILSGVKIGQGAVVAAGSVVTKDVPKYAIVAGIPAKVIGYRFNEEKRGLLSNIEYTSLSADYVRNNIDLFYQDINTENVSVDMLKEKIENLVE